MQDVDGRELPSRRWWVLPTMLVGLVVAFLGWFDRSESVSIDLGSPSRIVVVGAAGPIRVTQGTSSTITHNDSWLVTRPKVEVQSAEVESSGAQVNGGQANGTEVVIRVRCKSRTPCRSSIDLQVAGNPDLLLISRDAVSIDRFAGNVTVFSDSGGVFLGPLEGSVRVVSKDDVHGSGLNTDELDISGTCDVDIWFGTPTSDYRVQVLDEAGEDRSSDESVELDLEVSAAAQRSVSIRTNGDVILRPFDKETFDREILEKEILDETDS